MLLSFLRSDERAYIHALVNNMPIPQSIPFIYPRMYALHNMDAKCGTIVAVDEDGEGPPGSLKLLGKQAVEMPEQMGLTAERLSSEGAFLLDNGVDVFMWFGRAVSPKLIQDLSCNLQVDARFVLQLAHRYKINLAA